MRELSTAYHEAGHAVIALAKGCTVQRVAIEEDGSGRCWLEFDDRRDYLIVLFAGGLAHARLEGRQFYELSTGCESDDREFAYHLQKWQVENPELSADRAWPRIYQESEQLVGEHWQQIVKLADRLMAVGTIDNPAQIAAAV